MVDRERQRREFREMFASETATRLDRLDQQLLEAEGRGADAELIDSLFRDAHTMKGTAGMVGMPEVGRIAHAIEDRLEPFRAGTSAPSPALVDSLLAAVDAIRMMLPGLVAGGRAEAETVAVEARLAAAGEAPPAAPDEPPAPPADPGLRHPGDAEAGGAESEPAARADPSMATTPAAVEAKRASVETIRVPVERLDGLVRLVGQAAAAHLRLGRFVAERLEVDPRTLPEYRDVSRSLADLQERAMRARMVPLATIAAPLQRTVRDLSRSLGKSVRWTLVGGDTEIDRGVLEQLADPLMHLVRNAVDHGLEGPQARAGAGKPAEGSLRLQAMQIGSEIVVAIVDDGPGIDADRVRAKAVAAGVPGAADLDDAGAHQLIFRAGLSTALEVTAVSGRGVGLDVVRAEVEALRGRVEVRSQRGVGTEFRLRVPITLAVLRCLIVRAGGQPFALAMDAVSLVAGGDDPSISRGRTADGRPLVIVADRPIPLVSLGATLDMAVEAAGPLVVVAGGDGHVAFRVGSVEGEREVVVAGLGGVLPHLAVVAGASVEADGSILVVLDPTGIVERSRTLPGPAPSSPANRPGGEPPGQPGPDPTAAPTMAVAPASGTAARILVVDDALTVRELQRAILERAGYEVVTAVDGAQALDLLGAGHFDLVLTDLEMPHLDGFGLVEAVRRRPEHVGLPIVMLTSRRSPADRARGLEAGADAYVVKSAFDQVALLAMVGRLLERPS